jgi:spore coat protein JB
MYDEKGGQRIMNQKELYEWIMMLGFCSLDMTLYLDTHPDDQAALDYWNQCNALYQSALESYEESYGPLTLTGGQQLDTWDWNTAPMPWEGGR